MEFIQSYIPTSKAQLIQVAMYFANGDTQKAQELFDFYNKNLSLPDFDPITPSFMHQVKANANDLFVWLKENQGSIINGYQWIQSVIQNRGAIIPVASAEEALEPINE